MLEVKDKKTLLSLHNHDKGELVKVLDEDKTYHFDGKDWIEYEAPQFQMSLYDINKQLYIGKPDLDESGLTSGQAMIDSYISKRSAKYYMLLNNELHYYTLFVADCDDGDMSVSNEVLNLLNYFDNVKAFELVEGAVEIWATLNGEMGCFMFFDYDSGVIKCK